MLNKVLLVVLEEMLSVSLLRSTSKASQVRTLINCHTDFSALTIKPALINEFKTKVDFSRNFSKELPIPKISSKKQQF